MRCAIKKWRFSKAAQEPATDDIMIEESVSFFANHFRVVTRSNLPRELHNQSNSPQSSHKIQLEIGVLLYSIIFYAASCLMERHVAGKRPTEVFSSCKVTKTDASSTCMVHEIQSSYGMRE